MELRRCSCGHIYDPSLDCRCPECIRRIRLALLGDSRPRDRETGKACAGDRQKDACEDRILASGSPYGFSALRRAGEPGEELL